MHPANRIAELRVASGMSPTQVAAALGVSAPTISRWESGRNGIPDHRKVQLAQLFGVTVGHLMCGFYAEDGNNGKVDAA